MTTSPYCHSECSGAESRNLQYMLQIPRQARYDIQTTADSSTSQITAEFTLSLSNGLGMTIARFDFIRKSLYRIFRTQKRIYALTIKQRRK